MEYFSPNFLYAALVVFLANAIPLHAADIRDVKAFPPDGSRFAEVHIKTSNEKSTFILPRLSIYTIVTFHTTKQTKGNER